jgi:hypothetical protein
MTPSYYQPLTKDSNKEPHQFIRYWQLEIQLLKTIGLGALLDNPEDEESQQPPYTLSAAASLDVKNNEKSENQSTCTYDLDCSTDANAIEWKNAIESHLSFN